MPSAGASEVTHWSPGIALDPKQAKRNTAAPALRSHWLNASHRSLRAKTYEPAPSAAAAATIISER